MHDADQSTMLTNQQAKEAEVARDMEALRGADPDNAVFKILAQVRVSTPDWKSICVSAGVIPCDYHQAFGQRGC